MTDRDDDHDTSIHPGLVLLGLLIAVGMVCTTVIWCVLAVASGC